MAFPRVLFSLCCCSAELSTMVKIYMHCPSGSHWPHTATGHLQCDCCNWETELFFYPHVWTCLLILERGEGRERERERDINVREKHGSVASCTCPNWGLNLQPWHLSWLGIEAMTFSLWDNAARVENEFLTSFTLIHWNLNSHLWQVANLLKTV